MGTKNSGSSERSRKFCKAYAAAWHWVSSISTLKACPWLAHNASWQIPVNLAFIVCSEYMISFLQESFTKRQYWITMAMICASSTLSTLIQAWICLDTCLLSGNVRWFAAYKPHLNIWFKWLRISLWSLSRSKNILTWFDMLKLTPYCLYIKYQECILSKHDPNGEYIGRRLAGCCCRISRQSTATVTYWYCVDWILVQVTCENCLIVSIRIALLTEPYWHCISSILCTLVQC